MQSHPLAATVAAAPLKPEALGAAADPGELFALPETGEALLTPKQVALALGVSEASVWAWVKSDVEFPTSVRRGERFTRFRLSEIRAYIAGLTAGVPKVSPAQRGREKARQVPA